MVPVLPARWASVVAAVVLAGCQSLGQNYYGGYDVHCTGNARAEFLELGKAVGGSLSRHGETMQVQGDTMIVFGNDLVWSMNNDQTQSFHIMVFKYGRNEDAAMTALRAAIEQRLRASSCSTWDYRVTHFSYAKGDL